MRLGIARADRDRHEGNGGRGPGQEGIREDGNVASPAGELGTGGRLCRADDDLGSGLVMAARLSVLDLQGKIGLPERVAGSCREIELALTPEIAVAAAIVMSISFVVPFMSVPFS